jgi:hypothetical protein
MKERNQVSERKYILNNRRINEGRKEGEKEGRSVIWLQKRLCICVNFSSHDKYHTL